MMPVAIDAAVPLLEASRTFTGITGDENASPAMPTPLFDDAPMTPATLVPCPLSSAAWSDTHVPDRQSAPEAVSTRPPARSGLVASTPESTTATGAPPLGE